MFTVTVAAASGLVMGFGCASSAHAAAAVPEPFVRSPACAPYDPQAVPVGKLAQITDQMLVSVHECQRSAPWLAALGHLLNRQQRYAEAADHLERSLMLDPDLQAGQLDYALALAGQGDIDTATAIVQNMLTGASLPEVLRKVLQRQLLAWSSPVELPILTPLTRLQSQWQWGGTASVRLGVDSNLLAAPDLQTLTLTLAGQSQTLPLDEAYRPQAGAYQQADLQLLLRRQPITAQDPTWDLAVGLRSRTSAAAAAGADQYDLTAERTTYRGLATTNNEQPQQINHRHGYYVNAAVYGLNNQTGTQIEVRGLGAGWGYNKATTQQLCEARLGPEVQEREYANNPLLAGRYFGLAATWACSPNQNESKSKHWQLSVKAGRDLSHQASRAGGDQTQTALRLLVRVPATALIAKLRANLLVDAEVSATQDSGPYSPLLENGAARSLRRSNLRFEYQQPLPKTAGLDTQWVLGLDWAQQQSNLPLFGVQSRSIYSTVRVAW